MSDFGKIINLTAFPRQARRLRGQGRPTPPLTHVVAGAAQDPADPTNQRYAIAAAADLLAWLCQKTCHSESPGFLPPGHWTPAAHLQHTALRIRHWAYAKTSLCRKVNPAGELRVRAGYINCQISAVLGRIQSPTQREILAKTVPLDLIPNAARALFAPVGLTAAEAFMQEVDAERPNRLASTQRPQSVVIPFPLRRAPVV
jgi:hypothetical protein